MTKLKGAMVVDKLRKKISSTLAVCLLVSWSNLGFAVNAAPLASAKLSSLQQIEEKLDNGLALSMAMANLSNDEAKLVLAEQRSGAKLFGTITYGATNEPLTDTSTEMHSYNKLSFTGGLVLPLLGTKNKEKIDIIQAQNAALASNYYAKIVNLNNLVAVRKAYASLWVEKQKEGLAKQFLSTEEATTKLLEERQKQGLLLPVDKLEFLTIYDEVRRDLLAMQLKETQALQIINLATGCQWQVGDYLEEPKLPILSGKTFLVSDYPEFQLQAKLVEQYEQMLKQYKQLNTEGNLVIGGTVSRDYPGASGSGAYIALTVTEPFGTIGKKDQNKVIAENQLISAKMQKDYVEMTLEGKVREAILTAKFAAMDVNARIARLTVLAEDIREKKLRHKLLPGDTFEQFQNSKSQYYRMALDLLNREETFLGAAIDVISFVYPSGLSDEKDEAYVINSNNINRGNLLNYAWLDINDFKLVTDTPMNFSNLPHLTFPDVGMNTINNSIISNENVKISNQIKVGTYVWQADPFLNSITQSVELAKLKQNGISKILLSFNSNEISNLKTPLGKQKLVNLLKKAQANDIEVALLLGDSSWLLPEHRQELVTLVKEMNDFSFKEIHLDIEPDAVLNTNITAMNLLVDTIKAVKNATTKDISLSIHPRYLSGISVKDKNDLANLKLKEIVVMMYSTNTEKVVENMKSIIKDTNGLNIALAQSVEKNVNAGESYSSSDHKEFINAIHKIENELSSTGLKIVYIQSWEDYGKGD